MKKLCNEMRRQLVGFLIFCAILLLSGCSENASIGIIGGADGPTAVFVTEKAQGEIRPQGLDMVFTIEGQTFSDANEAQVKENQAKLALMQQLCQQVIFSNGQVSLRIPENSLPEGARWSILFAGRIQPDLSAHWFEQEEAGQLWKAGESYTADCDLTSVDQLLVEVAILSADQKTLVSASGEWNQPAKSAASAN